MKHLVLVDEGLLSFRDRANTIKGHASLSPLQGMGREAGISFYVTTLAPRLTDESLRSNVYLTAAFRPANGEDADHLARTHSLSGEQTTYLQAMPRGQVILKIGRVPHPILATFDPITKTVDEAAYDAARDRTTNFCRTLMVSEERTQQPPTATVPLTPARLLQASETTTNKRVALNKHTVAVLQDVADHPYTLCTPCYRRCALLLAQGDRARSQGERLGLLRADRVTTGRGRGKTGVALSLSPAGWAWLDRTPTKGLRGGSAAQHSYCVMELARHIPGAIVEELLGTKSVDLAIPFNATRHAPLCRALHALAGSAPLIQDGQIMAIEVDTTPKTAVRNSIKNAAAGVALTILAIADRAPERLAALLPPNAFIVDVFALLEALREEES